MEALSCCLGPQLSFRLWFLAFCLGPLNLAFFFFFLLWISVSRFYLAQWIYFQIPVPTLHELE